MILCKIDKKFKMDYNKNNIFYEVTAMKRKKIPILLLTAVCCLAMLPTAAPCPNKICSTILK